MGFTAFPRPPPRPKIAQNRAFSARETQNCLSATNRVLYNGHPHLSYGAQLCDPPMGPVYNGHPHLSYGAQPCDPPMGPCTTGITPTPPKSRSRNIPKQAPKEPLFTPFHPTPSNPHRTASQAPHPVPPSPAHRYSKPRQTGLCHAPERPQTIPPNPVRTPQYPPLGLARTCPPLPMTREKPGKTPTPR